MRHAKSSWKDDSLPDSERPLARRGIKDAGLIARYMQQHQLTPEYIYCSSSLRTRQTLEYMGRVIYPFPDHEFEETLYVCSVKEMVYITREIPDRLERVMLLGHNPGVRLFTEKLIGGPFPHPKFSTCAFAVLRLDISSWHAVDADCGELTTYIAPKMLKS